MTTVRDVLAVIEAIAPLRWGLPGDRIGLQLGDPDTVVERGVVALDASLGAVQKATETRAQILVCHHPLIWEPLKSVALDTPSGCKVAALIRGEIAFIAAHTNWDAAIGGINDTLTALLDLNDVVPFGSAASEGRLKVTVFLPEDRVEPMLDALAAAGAGEIGRYRRCGYWASGTGTYVGGEGTNPSVGRLGRIERVAEARLEAVLPTTRRDAVERAIRAAHSYEEPAYDFYRLTDRPSLPLGRVGELSSSAPLGEFVAKLDRTLETRCLAWGNPRATVRRVAVCGGAADDEWREAKAAGADVLVTGEVKQHVGLECAEAGFGIVAAGHYATEHPGCASLRDRLASELPEVGWNVFVPSPGESGRPFHGA